MNITRDGDVYSIHCGLGEAADLLQYALVEAQTQAQRHRDLFQDYLAKEVSQEVSEILKCFERMMALEAGNEVAE